MIKKIFIFILIITLSSCAAFKPEKVDTRKVPIKASERAKKNINQGSGTSLNNILRGRGGSTNFEFSSSNPMWRASLEILDFLPLATVDYSGGMLITDWYTDGNSNEAIKISIRFLANEVRSDSVKVIVHKKKCFSPNECNINLLNNSTIEKELRASIVRKAAELEKISKNKKK
jgi:hypothetical protein